MQGDLPILTTQDIFDEAMQFLERGSNFQTTAYDTNLLVSDSNTYSSFHHFELFGRNILWVNQARKDDSSNAESLMPRTIFKCDPNNFDGHIVAHRFASLLCYVTSTAISPRVWGVGSLPAPSIIQPSEKYIGRLVTHDQIDSSIANLQLDNFTDKKWIALAHYRQVTLAQTPYYEVLSYWKILELYFDNVGSDMDTYINGLYTSRPDIFHTLSSFTGTASAKLRSVRHSCAHFRLNGDVIQDPDNPDLFNIVSEAIFPLRRLAEGLIDKTTGW